MNALNQDLEDVVRPPQSGFFDKIPYSRGIDPEQVLDEIRAMYHTSSVAVLLHSHKNNTPRAAAFPRQPEFHDSCLADYLAAWLDGIRTVRAPVVPDLLRPWLPMHRVFVLPIQASGFCAGYLVLEPADLDHASLEPFRAYVYSLALRIAAQDWNKALPPLRLPAWPDFDVA